LNPRFRVESGTLMGRRSQASVVHRSPLVTGLAAVFAGVAALFVLLGVVYSPVFLVVATLFGAVAYLTWYHASGKLAARLYRGVERQAATNAGEQRRDSGRAGGFGGEPREEWRPPRDGQSAREAGRERRRRAAGPAGGGGRQQRAARQKRQQGPKPADYRILGVDPGADESDIKAAYRKKVKEVHPDTDSGDEQEFKRVQSAYERLTGESV
jgi:hypothetical protein